MPRKESMFDWLKDYSELRGEALYLATLIIIIIIAFFWARYYFAPGTERLSAAEKRKQEEREAQRENEREAIAILKGQLEEQRKQHAEQREADERRAREEREEDERRTSAQREADASRIRELENRLVLVEEKMRQESEWNRVYRHALANREHMLGFAYDAALLMIDAIIEECNVGDHFVRQRRQMRSATDLRQDVPLPKSPEAMYQGAGA